MAGKKNGTKLTRSQLSNAAAELNEVLEPDPPINAKAKKDELETKIKEAGGLIDPEADELTESTWSVLEKIGAAHRPAQEYVPQRDEGGEEAAQEAAEEETPAEESQQASENDDFNDTEAMTQSNTEQAQEGQSETTQTDNSTEVQGSKPAGKKKGSGAERRAFMETLIKQGKHTKKEIVDKTLEQFPNIARSTPITEITDGKNPKYNKFSAPLHIDENKVVSFKEDK